MTGIPENGCIAAVLALQTVPSGIFIPHLRSCSLTLVPPAEIVCPGIPTLSSYTQTPCTVDLGVTCVGLGVSVLLRTVTSLSPFPHPGQWGYPSCLIGLAARRAHAHAECLALVWLSQAGHAPLVFRFHHPNLVCKLPEGRTQPLI